MYCSHCRLRNDTVTSDVDNSPHALHWVPSVHWECGERQLQFFGSQYSLSCIIIIIIIIIPPINPSAPLPPSQIVNTLTQTWVHWECGERQLQFFGSQYSLSCIIIIIIIIIPPINPSALLPPPSLSNSEYVNTDLCDYCRERQLHR